MPLNPPTRFDHLGNGYLDYYAPHNTYHPGVDLNWGAPEADFGQDVMSPIGGEVVYVSPRGSNGGLGLYLVLVHPEYKCWTRYMHLSDCYMAVGQKFPAEYVIGKVGKSGTTNSHLHWEVLNEKGFAHIQTNKNMPFGRYFAGLTRGDVANLTIDPIAFLRDNEKTPLAGEPWKKQAQDFAIHHGLITSGWDNPDQPMSQIRVAAALEKLYNKLAK